MSSCESAKVNVRNENNSLPTAKGLNSEKLQTERASH